MAADPLVTSGDARCSPPTEGSRAMDTFTCTTCGTPVTEDSAFLRSVNLVTTAWCRPCWFEKQGLPQLPEQRESSVAPPRPARRWARRRHDVAQKEQLEH